MKRKCVLLCLALAGLATAVSATDAEAIRARTAARRPAIVELERAGAVEEGDDGFLKIRRPEVVGDRAELIAAENADRRAAYAAIAKATGVTPEEVGKRQAQRLRRGG